MRSEATSAAGVGLAHADAPHVACRRGSPAASGPAARRCRTGAASGRSGGRRTSRRPAARPRRSAPRTPRTARAACGRRRPTSVGQVMPEPAPLGQLEGEAGVVAHQPAVLADRRAGRRRRRPRRRASAARAISSGERSKSTPGGPYRRPGRPASVGCRGMRAIVLTELRRPRRADPRRHPRAGRRARGRAGRGRGHRAQPGRPPAAPRASTPSPDRSASTRCPGMELSGRVAAVGARVAGLVGGRRGHGHRRAAAPTPSGSPSTSAS